MVSGGDDQVDDVAGEQVSDDWASIVEFQSWFGHLKRSRAAAIDCLWLSLSEFVINIAVAELELVKFTVVLVV